MVTGEFSRGCQTRFNKQPILEHNEVEVLKYNDIVKMFKLKEQPEIKGEPTGFPCLVVKDEKRYDY